MQIVLFNILLVLGIIVLGFALCILSDRMEQRRQLKGLRKQLLSEPSISDDQFALGFGEIEPQEVIEMRSLLAAVLGIDAPKIRPEWRFREDSHLKNMDVFIYHAFACRYAPERLRNQAFQFPKGAVSTVRDLFIEAHRLKDSDETIAT